MRSLEATGFDDLGTARGAMALTGGATRVIGSRMRRQTALLIAMVCAACGGRSADVYPPGRARSRQARARPFVDVEQSEPPPATRAEPGPRADHGRRRWHGSDRLPPPVEVHRRRAGI